MDVAPKIVLKNCSLTSLTPHLDRDVPMTDVGNVKITAPININENASVQSNPFGTVHNYYPEHIYHNSTSPTRPTTDAVAAATTPASKPKGKN